jgi:TatD DNase family protein
MDLVDICANLTHESFHDDIDAVLARAHEAGVNRLAITGADEASSDAALDLARRDPDSLRATAGVHPHVAAEASDRVIDHLRALAEHPLVSCVGEAGLDFNRDFSPRDAQERLFEAQLELAADLDLPVFAHERDAHERFMAILREWRHRVPAIVVHCFTGSPEALDAYLDMDCHIGLTGWVCDERRGTHLLECIHRIPDNRLMVETDAPYLMPRDLKPKPKTRRNEPANLPHIVRRIAEARGEPPETTAEHTTATALRFFGFPTDEA